MRVEPQYLDSLTPAALKAWAQALSKAEDPTCKAIGEALEFYAKSWAQDVIALSTCHQTLIRRTGNLNYND